MGTDFLYEAEEAAHALKIKDITGTSRIWKMIAMPLIYAVLSIAQSLKAETNIDKVQPDSKD